MDIKEKFGSRIAYLRKAKGISQETLAELSGLHRTYISSLEVGKRNISIVAIEKLAIGLECEITDFFIK